MVTVRWFPPSWLLVRTARSVAYIDPAWIQTNFRRHPTAVVFTHYPDPMDGLPELDLPRADLVLITHHHQDHVKTATLRRLCDHHTTVVAPARCSALIDRPFVTVASGRQLTIGEFDVTTVPSANTPEGRSTRKQHKPGDCVGYVLSAAGRRIYHAGDTDLLPEMAQLSAIDVAFLPVGGTFTMDAEEAVEAARLVGAGLTVPMHFRRESHAAAFVEGATRAGLSARRLGIGEVLRA